MCVSLTMLNRFAWTPGEKWTPPTKIHAQPLRCFLSDKTSTCRWRTLPRSSFSLPWGRGCGSTELLEKCCETQGWKNKFGTGKGWSAQRASWRSEGVPSVQQGHKLYAQFSRRGAICKAWFPATWVFGARWHYAGIFDGCPPATAAAKAAAAQSSCPFPS